MSRQKPDSPSRPSALHATSSNAGDVADGDPALLLPATGLLSPSPTKNTTKTPIKSPLAQQLRGDPLAAELLVAAFAAREQKMGLEDGILCRTPPLSAVLSWYHDEGGSAHRAALRGTGAPVSVAGPDEEVRALLRRILIDSSRPHVRTTAVPPELKVPSCRSLSCGSLCGRFLPCRGRRHHSCVAFQVGLSPGQGEMLCYTPLNLCDLEEALHGNLVTTQFFSSPQRALKAATLATLSHPWRKNSGLLRVLKVGSGTEVITEDRSLQIGCVAACCKPNVSGSSKSVILRHLFVFGVYQGRQDANILGSATWQCVFAMAIVALALFAYNLL